VRAQLIERFGDRILDDVGQVDRGAIARIVFGDREQLEWLERLLHPRVAQEYLDWREQLGRLPNPPEVCVTEVPLLYEVGGDERFDEVVVITAPAEIRAERSQAAGELRESRLIPDEEKAKRADFVYVNDGTLDELDAFVADVMRKLSA
jgi:dephospho-CoA kinase